jgi:glycerol uptake facilitator-like aquaporin
MQDELEAEALADPATPTVDSLRPLATPSLGKMLLAEGIGTALLLATVVGSGIMGERLAGGNVALALLANSLATGSGLVALILAFGPVSGAHFNPVVTLSLAARGETPWGRVPLFVAVQILGSFLGVWAAHYMFELPLLQASRHARTGGPQWASEALATAGLLLVILGSSKARPSSVPFAVGAYIAAAYWFTSSTSFANPAVTLARAFTDTFAGIRPADVGGFVAAQLVGAAVATALSKWFSSEEAS